ncbi:hypothetical protein HYPSUDRAFT_42846 [Hypholoma sublateritium FD-334 SS-4]|uniref:Ku C-terminal domain-containing protein n=1 Tax=Hypholoma sublateritium (strain FD-334 SS-4) TaxID=945553 RepID=A0A0D2NPR0_HYPSF|nr:hypothetical protein HYPSUDRAFT_42846 [Hypholoma sublateritium FD-334 SS-4]
MLMSSGEAQAQLAIQFITDLQQQCDAETYGRFMNLLAEYHKQGNEAAEASASVDKRKPRLF